MNKSTRQIKESQNRNKIVGVVSNLGVVSVNQAIILAAQVKDQSRHRILAEQNDQETTSSQDVPVKEHSLLLLTSHSID
jgi:hypothetical protein